MQPLRIVFCTVLFAGLSGARAEGVEARTWRANDDPPSVAVGVQEGARAARAGSTLGAALVSGGASVVVPGLGLAGLLFVKPAAAKASLHYRAGIRGVSPEFAAAWARAYETSLARRRARAVLLGSIVGSVLGYFLLYRHRTL